MRSIATRAHLLLPIFFAAGIPACDSTEPGALGVIELLVRTDKPVYSLSVDRAANVQLINQSSVRIYAPMNEYVYVEQSSDAGWINRRPWFAVDGIGVSFAVEPGDTLSAPAMDFGYVNNQAGVYRFVFEVALDEAGRHLAPEDQRVSASFEVGP